MNQYLSRLNISLSKIDHVFFFSRYVLKALPLMNFYTRSNTVNMMVFHFAKVDVLSGLFSGMLFSHVLSLCSLNNDQYVTSTFRFTSYMYITGLEFKVLFSLFLNFFLYVRFSFL